MSNQVGPGSDKGRWPQVAASQESPDSATIKDSTTQAGPAEESEHLDRKRSRATAQGASHAPSNGEQKDPSQANVLGFAQRFVLHPGLWGTSGTALACVSQNIWIAAGFAALALYAAYNEARLGSPSLAKGKMSSPQGDTEDSRGFFTKLRNLCHNVSGSRGVAYTINAAYGASVAAGNLAAGQLSMACAFGLIAAGAAAVSLNLNRRRDGDLFQPRESFEFFNSIKASWDRLPAKAQSVITQPSLWYCTGVGFLCFDKVALTLQEAAPVIQGVTGIGAALMTYGAIGPVIGLLRGDKTADVRPLTIGGGLGFAVLGLGLGIQLGATVAGSFALWAVGNYLNAQRMLQSRKPSATAAHNAGTGGTTWNAVAANTYGHGPDGQVFHDSHVVELLERYLPKAQTILDLGCGTGCFAPNILSIAQSHMSTGIRFIYFWDPNSAMLEKCKEKARESLHPSITVQYEQAGVNDLERLHDGSVDVVLSSLVGCNLNKDTLYLQFKQINRCLKPGGVAIVTAPNSLDVVFTNGSGDKEATISGIQDRLNAIGDVQESKALEALREKFNGDQSILRASFIHEEGRVRLVQEGETIPAGASIYRLIPGLVVPNYAHTVDEYLAAAIQAGLTIKEQESGQTLTSAARALWNAQPGVAQLGREFERYPPFAVFVFQKLTGPV
jgi:SAM-dependent methyltransferase